MYETSVKLPDGCSTVGEYDGRLDRYATKGPSFEEKQSIMARSDLHGRIGGTLKTFYSETCEKASSNAI